MPPRLPFLDGLRGIAILMVLACHTLDHFLTLPPGTRPPPFWSTIEAGKYGVVLFFVVSAFSLFLTSRARYLSSARPLGDFLIRRAFRILPGWWIACALYAWLLGRTLSSLMPQIFMYFGFLRYLPEGHLFDADWSIFVEEVFYLMLPFLFRWVRDVKAAAWFLGVSLLFRGLWIAGSATLLGSLPGYDLGRNFIAYFPLNHLPSFALGILIFFLEPKFTKSGMPDRRWLRLGLEGLTFVALGITLFQWDQWTMVGFALVLLLATSESTFFGRLSRRPWLGHFGRCCYSIYLFHLFILHALEPIMVAYLNYLGIAKSEPILAWFAWFPIVAVVNLAVGSLTYFAIERPFIQLSKRLTSAPILNFSAAQ
jgi:peptidoglycan/LPS O-acetylase OafA/YrhL